MADSPVEALANKSFNSSSRDCNTFNLALFTWLEKPLEAVSACRKLKHLAQHLSLLHLLSMGHLDGHGLLTNQFSLLNVVLFIGLRIRENREILENRHTLTLISRAFSIASCLMNEVIFYQNHQDKMTLWVLNIHLLDHFVIIQRSIHDGNNFKNLDETILAPRFHRISKYGGYNWPITYYI